MVYGFQIDALTKENFQLQNQLQLAQAKTEAVNFFTMQRQYHTLFLIFMLKTYVCVKVPLEHVYGSAL